LILVTVIFSGSVAGGQHRVPRLSERGEVPGRGECDGGERAGVNCRSSARPDEYLPAGLLPHHCPLCWALSRRSSAAVVHSWVGDPREVND